jgi:hypothetical protein
MSNNPILPIIPGGAGIVGSNDANDEEQLPVNDDNLDDGETNDDRDTVDKDVDEADEVNKNLDR